MCQGAQAAWSLIPAPGQAPEPSAHPETQRCHFCPCGPASQGPSLCGCGQLQRPGVLPPASPSAPLPAQTGQAQVSHLPFEVVLPLVGTVSPGRCPPRGMQKPTGGHSCDSCCCSSCHCVFAAEPEDQVELSRAGDPCPCLVHSEVVGQRGPVSAPWTFAHHHALCVFFSSLPNTGSSLTRLWS